MGVRERERRGEREKGEKWERSRVRCVDVVVCGDFVGMSRRAKREREEW
jgi:hypothetical protein